MVSWLSQHVLVVASRSKKPRHNPGLGAAGPGTRLCSSLGKARQTRPGKWSLVFDLACLCLRLSRIQCLSSSFRMSVKRLQSSVGSCGGCTAPPSFERHVTAIQPRNSQCKPDQASRGAKQQRTIVDARMVGQFFRAYAAWVAQARVLQAGQDALASQKCWLMLALHSDNCGIHEKQQGFLKRHGTRSRAPKT